MTDRKIEWLPDFEGCVGRFLNDEKRRIIGEVQRFARGDPTLSRPFEFRRCTRILLTCDEEQRGDTIYFVVLVDGPEVVTVVLATDEYPSDD